MNETRKTRDTEQQLYDAITAFADTIHPAPDAYRTAHREWHRRERRRFRPCGSGQIPGPHLC